MRVRVRPIVLLFALALLVFMFMRMDPAGKGDPAVALLDGGGLPDLGWEDGAVDLGKRLNKRDIEDAEEEEEDADDDDDGSGLEQTGQRTKERVRRDTEDAIVKYRKNLKRIQDEGDKEAMGGGGRAAGAGAGRGAGGAGRSRAGAGAGDEKVLLKQRENLRKLRPKVQERQQEELQRLRLREQLAGRDEEPIVLRDLIVIDTDKDKKPRISDPESYYEHSNDDDQAWLTPPVQRVPLAIITTSSSNHYCTVASLIDSVRVFEPTAKLIFYDIGLSDSERRWVRSVDSIDYRVFPWHLYPSYFNVSVEAGEYAWKVVMIKRGLEEADVVIWMDGGDRLHGALGPVLEATKREGFYSGMSSGNLKQWSHPGMLDYFKVDPQHYYYGNCNGAFLGFSREKTYDSLMKDWYDCAMNRDCIAPPGSNRGNHRQDQAALTILCAQSNGRFKCGQNQYPQVYSFHNDAWTKCPELPNMMSIGMPTSLRKTAQYDLTSLRNVAFKPAAGSIAASVASRLANLFKSNIQVALLAPTASLESPPVSNGHKAVVAGIIQLAAAIGKNSRFTALTLNGPGDEAGYAQLEQAVGLKLDRSRPGNAGAKYFLSHVGAPVTWAQGRGGETDVKKALEGAGGALKSYNVIVVYGQLMAGPFSLVTEMKAVYDNEINTRSGKVVVVWDLRESQVPSTSPCTVDFTSFVAANANDDKSVRQLLQFTSFCVITFTFSLFSAPSSTSQETMPSSSSRTALSCQKTSRRLARSRTCCHSKISDKVI